MVETRPDDRSSETTSSAVGRLLRIALVTLLLVGSLWFVLRDVDFGRVWEAATEASLPFILLVGLFVLLAHLARAVRWRLLIPEGEKISLRDLFSATVVGYFASNVIPRSGELLRPWVLARRTDRPVGGLLATVVFERLLDSVTLLAILGGILLLAEEELAALLGEIDQLAGMTPTDLLIRLSIPIALLVILLVLMVFTPFGSRIVRTMARPLPQRYGTKIITFFDRFREGIRPIEGLSGSAGLLFWTIVIWSGYALSLHAGVLAFGLEESAGLGFGDSVVILGLTTIGVAIAPTPGGFGIFHTFARVTLALLYGVPVETAVAFAFTVHFAQFAATMIAGGYYAVREGANVFRFSSENGRDR